MTHSRSIWRALLLVLAAGVAAAARPASAQTAQRSALVGRVTDVTGAPISLARVTVSGEGALGGPRTVETDPDGRYRFTALLPGTYVLAADADGFQPVRQPALRLPVETTWTVDFMLTVRSVTEAVEVPGIAPMVDVTTSATPTVLDRALLQNLPTGRTLVAILNLAPGTTESVSFGGTQNSNGLAIDGVSVVEPVLGRPWVGTNYNWLESVQVVALGTPAEYGQSTGATGNGVLRSGSNRFSGLGEYVAAVPDWTGKNTGGLEARFQKQFAPRELRLWWDANGQLGGPVRRDRLWFFAGLGIVSEEYRPFGYPGPAVARRREPQGLVKLDAAPGADVRAQGFYQYTGGSITGEQLSPWAASLDVAGQRRSRNHTWHARSTWVARAATTVEGRIGGFSGWSDYGPVDRTRVSGPHPRQDIFTGQLVDNVQTMTDDDRRSVTASVRLTHVRRVGGALHDVAVALELEDASSRVFWGFPGNRIDSYVNGAYRSSTLWNGEDVRTGNRRVTFYLQDRWAVSRQLTIEPGLRVESYGGRPRHGSAVFSTTPVALRLGAAWDLTPSHRTVLRAHYGRYHDMLFSQIYSWHDRDGLSPRRIGIFDASGRFLEQSVTDTSVPAYPIDPRLKQSHVDQFSAGIEHQPWRHVSVEARYVARRFGNFIGYIDRRLDEWTPFTGPDPGPDGVVGSADDGGTLTGYIPYWWPSGPRELVIANPEGAMRRYDAVQLVARKRQAGNWEAQASYTWSRTSGTIPGQEHSNATYWNLSPLGFGGSPGGTTSLRDQTFTHSAFDYSELKLFGWARVARLGGAVVGGVFRVHNGQRWHRIVQLIDEPTQMFYPTPAEEPFSRLTPTLPQLDLRIEKTVPLGRSRLLGLYLDALNAGNLGRARAYLPQSGTNFGRPRAWTAPRTMRLGLRYTF